MNILRLDIKFVIILEKKNIYMHRITTEDISKLIKLNASD